VNLEFSLKLDHLVKEYVVFQKKKFKAYEFTTELPPVRARLLKEQEAAMDQRIDQIDEEGNKLFDEKSRVKTVVLSIDEHLVYFMKLVKAGYRSFTTLQKMLGRKGRIVEFFTDRFKLDDLPLSQLEYRFIEQLETYCLTTHKMVQNSASKYTATFKDIMTRAVANGWMPANIFLAFQSKYERTRREWLAWEDMNWLIHHQFSKDTLNLVRDLYVFEAFTGYAYAEIRSARPSDFRGGNDGKLWLSKDRRKTDSEETLPMLPIPLQLIDKYKDHPTCIKRGTLFPVPSNEHYNRCLKKIAEEAGTSILLITHSARYFFANEILFNNGVQLKTIAGIMGQESVQSAEVYVRANRTATSESMEMVESKLYGKGGKLAKNIQTGQEAKVETMQAGNIWRSSGNETDVARGDSSGYEKPSCRARTHTAKKVAEEQRGQGIAGRFGGNASVHAGQRYSAVQPYWSAFLLRSY
jgi:site-specific recombinase XerD